jgi:hypothetical protein
MRTATQALSAIVVMSTFFAISARPSTVSITKFADYWTNKSFWESVHWDAIDTSDFGRDPKWTVPQGRNGDKMPYRQSTVSLFGRTWEAQLLHEPAASLTLVTRNVSRIACEDLQRAFTEVFGTPIRADDTSPIAPYGSNKRHVNIRYQWDLNGSRINGSCEALVDHESEITAIYAWSLTYGAVDTLKKLTPDQYLRCHQRIGNVDHEDLRVIVNYDAKLVKRPDGTPFRWNTGGYFSSDGTTLKLTGDPLPGDIRDFPPRIFINLVTGDLNGDQTLHDETLKIVGHCDLVDHF